LATEVKIVKFTPESLKCIQELTVAIKENNKIISSIFSELQDGMKMDFVEIMEGGEYEEDKESLLS
jgi:hypothetical protein